MKVSLGFALIWTQLFVFVNASWIFGERSTAYRWLLAVYLIMFSLTYAIPDLRSRWFDLGLVEWAKIYGKHLLIAMIIMFFIGAIFVNTNIGLNTLLNIHIGHYVYHFLVVAPIEEAMFRLYAYEKVGAVVSSVMFSAFHIAAYGASIINFVMAFIMGLVYIWINKKARTEKTAVASAAYHGAWNIMAVATQSVVKVIR